MEKKKTLVIGASENKERYSNMAVQKLMSHQQPVVALGAKKGKIGDTIIETEKIPLTDIDTVTLILTQPGNLTITVIFYRSTLKE